MSLAVFIAVAYGVLLLLALSAALLYRWP